MNHNGGLHPNALVPFCAFQTNMLGHLVETSFNRSFIACSLFQPSILEGQLCYSLDINKVAKVKSGAGKGNGLLLIIDAGFTVLKDDNSKQESSLAITTLNLEETSEESQGPKMYMNTLERYTTFKQGSFAMSSLKRMTGTDNYIANEDKDCIVETFEDCQARRYLEEVGKQCGCVPWSLAARTTVTVNDLVVFF